MLQQPTRASVKEFKEKRRVKRKRGNGKMKGC
jgi:hypothetical protein